MKYRRRYAAVFPSLEEHAISAAYRHFGQWLKSETDAWSKVIGLCVADRGAWSGREHNIVGGENTQKS